MNIPKWRCYLSDYHDKIVCDFLQHGWPVPLLNETFLYAITHPPYKSAITEYIFVELAHDATQGPFDPSTNPFKLPIYKIPLMTEPKKGSDSKRHVVLDFSYPPGSSVKDGISKDLDLDERFHFRLTGSAQFIDIINHYGPGCLIFKVDLKRAYR